MLTVEQELKLYRNKYKDEMRLNNSIVYRQDGEKWTLPRAITLGERSFSSASYLYEVKGFQKPLKGEYYLSGAKNELIM